MTAMPLLNRQPETPHIQGLLVVLALILLIAALRYPQFFLHQILGAR
jgi:hypothetical protein